MRVGECVNVNGDEEKTKEYNRWAIVCFVLFRIDLKDLSTHGNNLDEISMKKHPFF